MELGPAAFDLAAIGETMVAFSPDGDPPRYRAVPGGAESNVVVGMARLGCRTRWVSRLGDDALGRLIEEAIAAAGADVAVERDADRPTGIYTKHIGPQGTAVAYYRRGSAATELSENDLSRIGPANRLHLTGITPALSESAHRMVEAVLDGAAVLGRRVSFDLNYRPALWADAATAARVLAPLAQRADIVFVGDDEAAELFGTTDAAVLSGALVGADHAELILKRGPGPASIVTEGEELSERSLGARVVDATGAGDAFAAGYLAGEVFGWAARDRLRLGHFLAAMVIGAVEDTPPAFSNDSEPITRERLDGMWGVGDAH
jgi:2-dehydro-3-deoxygluconokinase